MPPPPSKTAPPSAKPVTVPSSKSKPTETKKHRPPRALTFKPRAPLPTACPICCPVPPVATVSADQHAVVSVSLTGDAPTKGMTRKARRKLRLELGATASMSPVGGVSPSTHDSQTTSGSSRSKKKARARRRPPGSETVLPPVEDAVQGTTRDVRGEQPLSAHSESSDAEWAAQCDTEWQYDAQRRSSFRQCDASLASFPPCESQCASCRLLFPLAPSLRAYSYSEHAQSREHAVALLQARTSAGLVRGEITAHCEGEALATVNKQMRAAIRVLVTRATRHGRKRQRTQQGPTPRDSARSGRRNTAMESRGNEGARAPTSLASARSAATPRMATGPSLAERIAEVRYFLEYTSGR